MEILKTPKLKTNRWLDFKVKGEREKFKVTEAGWGDGETGRLGEKETRRRRLFFKYLNPNLTGG
jgi:hypothetical protein